MRLSLRLGTVCNNGCGHCTVADLRGREPDRSTMALFDALVRGRQEGAGEVVFLRGEATIRPDFLRLVRRARDLGYGWVQVQSNGRMFATPGFVRDALNAGMSQAEVSFYGKDAQTHDAIARVEGAYAQTLKGIRKLLFDGALCHVNIPVLRENLNQLPEMVFLLAAEGVERVQLVMTRPTMGQSIQPPGLEEAMGSILQALQAGGDSGIHVGTEGIPICLLGAFSSAVSDRYPPATPVLIDDLHRRLTDLDGLREEYRPFPEACTPCQRRQECPGTWRGLWEGAVKWRPQPFPKGGPEA